jgi:hypothetical protein
MKQNPKDDRDCNSQHRHDENNEDKYDLLSQLIAHANGTSKGYYLVE